MFIRRRGRFWLRVLFGLTLITTIIGLYIFVFVGDPRQNKPDNLESFSTGIPHEQNVLSDRRQIVFVEEHQDVIPYWLQAAENGSIGISGNTLIHIDAHQDGAPPPFPNSFPFKWPKKLTSDVYAHLMSSNDAFIVSAIAMGLINKFIWIKPSWTDGSYVNNTFEIGITDRGHGTEVCVCEWKKNKSRRSAKRKTKEMRGQPRKEREGKHMSNEARKDINKRIRQSQTEEKPHLCFIFDRSEIQLNDTDFTSVSYNNCEIKAKYRYYEVSERKAIQLLSAIRKKEQKDPRIILDIDEDYFGVENRLKTYFKDGGKEASISKIDQILAGLFCPKTGEEKEIKANKLMLEYIQTVIAKCHTDGQKCHKERVLEIGKYLFGDGKDQDAASDLFCQDTIGSDDEQFYQLSDLLWSLSKNELEALQKIKFCNYTFIYEDMQYMESAFQTCKGTGNHALTEYYMANETEMSIRAKRFEDIVSFIFKQYSTPGITTICRSMRDGYTPASHFQNIEKYVKDALCSAPYHHTNIDFHYDNKLLFGSTGWIVDDVNN